MFSLMQYSEAKRVTHEKKERRKYAFAAAVDPAVDVCVCLLQQQSEQSQIEQLLILAFLKGFFKQKEAQICTT